MHKRRKKASKKQCAVLFGGLQEASAELEWDEVECSGGEWAGMEGRHTADLPLAAGLFQFLAYRFTHGCGRNYIPQNSYVKVSSSSM